jgi:sulfur carrier protein
MIQIKVNNETVHIEPNCSVSQLITNHKFPSKGIAIAVNQEVVPKTNWDNFTLQQNDEILIITATQGG